ncbi:MAG TPA: GC-type dockerin domain-anchored protein [Phycisphaerales bacterium]|nr:GC-type dockerin domain-anchored protein [Phycisphaerales bacterium]
MHTHSAIVGAALAALCVSSAAAQLIQPDSATATSEFNASYDIGNAIDGSGLPANFTLADPHANYTTNNHWTTRNGETIGESATFTFNNPQTLGVFHMWNHRSNGVASNQFYEPVLFDLELFDGANGAGASLLQLTSVAAVPNFASAQSFPFTVTANVRSVRFTVRATENNNTSPYTGLAEARFGPCVEVTIPQITQPASVAACPGETVSFAVIPAGSGPFSFQWQWRQGAGAWANISEGANGTLFTAVGSQLAALTLFPTSSWPLDTGLAFRALVTNPCSTVESAVAAMPVDPADLGVTGGVPGRDGTYDNNDFVVFIDYFFAQNPRADLGSTGGVFGPDGAFDNNDFVSFINEFFGGC